jgi:hypothetical protein
VGRLVSENGADGVRLYLVVSGELNEDIMVFGQEPCSRGRYKRRNVSYLGLLPPPIGGLSEITRLYKAKFGEPRPGQKVFIVTCQERDGWKGLDQETSETVPERPKGEQELQELNGLPGLHGVNVSASGFPETSKPVNSQNPYMHKGSTRDAEGTVPPVGGQCPAGTEPGVGGVEAAGAAIGGDGESKT